MILLKQTSNVNCSVNGEKNYVFVRRILYFSKSSKRLFSRFIIYQTLVVGYWIRLFQSYYKKTAFIYLAVRLTDKNMCLKEWNQRFFRKGFPSHYL